jgi:hypothetical protein
MRAALALIAVIGLASPACRFGPASSVLDGANLEIIAGERVQLDVDALARTAQASAQQPLSMFVALPVGAHAGQLVIGDGDSARCAPVLATTRASGVTVLAFDAAQVPLCAAALVDAGVPDAGFVDAGFNDDAGFDDAGFADAGNDDAGFADAGFADAGFADAGFADAGFVDAGNDDAGVADAGFPDAGPPILEVFVSLTETQNDLVCLTPPHCATVTTVHADGSIVVVDHAQAPQLGTIDADDLTALIDQATSGAADTLFAGADGSCLQTGLLDRTVFERVTADGEGVQTTTDVDVTICLSGIANALQARLNLLRSLL